MVMVMAMVMVMMTESYTESISLVWKFAADLCSSDSSSWSQYGKASDCDYDNPL